MSARPRAPRSAKTSQNEGPVPRPLASSVVIREQGPTFFPGHAYGGTALNHRTSDAVIGIHVASHDSAACLIRDGMIIAAEEERFSRQKHHSGFPHAALEYCLNRAGVELRQVDSILITYSPTRLIGTAVRHTLSWNSDLSPTNRIRYIGDELKILSQNLGAWLNCVRISPSTLKGINFCEHHIAHAAGAFLQSEFSQAAVLSVDGYGDSDSATISLADEFRIRILARVRFPASLGLLYNATTAYLGFRPDCDEEKSWPCPRMGNHDLRTFSLK